MRMLTLPLLLATLAATAADPDKMLVVVHSSSAVVAQYVCNGDEFAGSTGIVVGSEVRSSGVFRWHVVGGKAPYTILKDNWDGVNRCITVQDAEGRIASGCGMIGTQVIKVQVRCNRGPLPADPYTAPTDSSDAKKAHKPAWDPGRSILDTTKYVPPVKAHFTEVDPAVVRTPGPVGPRNEPKPMNAGNPPPTPRNVESLQPARVVPVNPGRTPSGPGPAPRGPVNIGKEQLQR